MYPDGIEMASCREQNGGQRALDKRRRSTMEKDVVCGMQVDPAKAAGTSQYGGKTYYFCSAGCKTKFDANPTQYLK
jgi:Cu+-exporting ATPase